MKITFLVTDSDAVGGTERAVAVQSEGLVERHDVEVISVYRTARTPNDWLPRRVRLRYLIDQTGEVMRPVRESGFDDSLCELLSATGSEIVDGAWEKAVNRLMDLEVQAALSTLDSDVLVTTTPALMALAVHYAPSSVAVVHQDHRVSELRGATGVPLHLFGHRPEGLGLLTEPTAEWFRGLLGAACPQITVIGNALSAKYQPKSTRRTRTVTVAGRLVGEKRVDDAIRAFAKVSTLHPDWTLRVCGAGPELSKLKEIAAGLGLHDRVQFLGMVSNMDEEWAKSSIALLTSRHEAWALVLIEAMGAGVPAVSYDCPNGPGAIITDGHDGLLVPSGDVEALAEGLLKLVSDQDLLDRYGAEAQRSSARFNLADATRRWEEFYTRLASVSPGERAAGRAARAAARIAKPVTTGESEQEQAVTTPSAPSGPGLVHSMKAHEVRIGALRDDVIRVRGQLHVVDDAVKPVAVFDRNLELVIAALKDAGVDYFAVRSAANRHHLGIRSEKRSALLEALGRLYKNDPVYVASLNTADKGLDTKLALLAGELREIETCPAIRVFQPLVTSEEELRYSGVYGCTVSFWAPETEEDHPVGMSKEPVLLSGMPTLAGVRVPQEAFGPDTLTVRDRVLPTVSAFAINPVYEVDFPVDVVYTWVDGADPAWVERRNETARRLGRTALDPAANAARFRDRDELRYSLRSVEQHLPWVRKIYLLTDGQTPSFLDTSSPRLEVIDHREIFRDPSVLPVFNSHAIESQLHRIEGLSEHFLYFNDDVFVGRLLGPTAFFHSNGLSKFFASPTAIPLSARQPDDEFNITAAKNNRALIEKTFGRTLVNAFLHTPHPLRRSVLEEIEDRFPEETMRTAAAPFRTADDLSIASSLHHYYGYLDGKAVPGRIGSGFINAGLREQHPKLMQLLVSRNHDVFCINDYHDGDVSEEEQLLVVGAFLQTYFPTPSTFER